ncbi:MAG: zf-TFIIB domain-containing protein [Desulfobacterales bacterium]
MPKLPLSCARCGGMWMMPEEIEACLKSGFKTVHSPEEGKVTEDHATGLCPNGHGIMTRAKVDLEPPFFLEKCPHCNGIWFDKGEWNRLAETDMISHLFDFWSNSWKKEQQEIKTRKRLEDMQKERFGIQLHEQILQLAGKANNHPKQAEIRFLLGGAFSEWLKSRKSGPESMGRLVKMLREHPAEEEITAHLTASFVQWQKDRIGDSFYAEIEKFLHEIESHPHKMEITAFLHQQFAGSTKIAETDRENTESASPDENMES